MPPREHKKVNYAEFETFSDSSSENNKKQNHGNYISWSASEDAILIEQVQKFIDCKKLSNDNDNDENQNNNINPINSLYNSNNNENNSNLNKEKNLPENKPKIKPEDNSINLNPAIKSNSVTNINTPNINPLTNINWVKIAEKLENKNARQCQTRWQNILDPNRVKGPWTKEEDMKLIELVKKFGPEKWSNISSYLPGRLGKQCRERWYNHLNPEVRKTGWSKEEEWVLFLLHRKYGNSWSTFSEKIPGRTDNTIKNHWNSIMKKNIVGITNQYQEMVKGKSKEEIEEIEKSIMAKCSEIMNKDYNEYYQEKMKEFPMMKLSKHNKKEKEKEKENDNTPTNNNLSKNNTSKKNLLDFAINNIEIKTPTKNKKKIFENIKIRKRTSKSKSKNKYKYKKNENKNESKEKERKHEGKENRNQSSSKKSNKYFNVNDDKELKIIKSGEKVLQQDKNILIKEAENKYKEKQKLKKGEKKNKSMPIIHRKTEEENEENNKNLEKMKTYSNKKTAKKSKRKIKNKSANNRKKKAKFNVSKLSNRKERESPKTNNNISNIKLNLNNPYINSSGNYNNLSPDFMSNNNMNFPYPPYPIDKFPYYIDDGNKILITESKDINKAKKEGQFPLKVPPNGPFQRTDIKNSSESSGGNNSSGKIPISPDFRMNPAFMQSNDNFYQFTIPQNYPNKKNMFLYSNSNPQMVRFFKGRENNNNNNKISTDSNSVHSYSMISANSAFKKSTPSSGSGRSFPQRGGGFLNFNNTADLNKEYFSSITLDEKNLNNKM